MGIVKVEPRLNEIMKDKGINQMELAKLADVPQPFISRFDKSENFNTHNIFSIAKALNINVEDLFKQSMKDDPK